jgi:hypothetical protein
MRLGTMREKWGTVVSLFVPQGGVSSPHHDNFFLIVEGKVRVRGNI